MKFHVDGKQFNEAIDKALLIGSSKSLAAFMSVTFKAEENDCVHILATDFTQTLDIVLEADVSECGLVMVHRNDIIRIGKLDGDVAIESQGDAFSVGNGRKRREVKASTEGEYIKPSALPEECFLFSCSGAELASTIANLNPLRSTSPTTPVYNGFHFDITHRRVVACSGYTVGVRGLAGEYGGMGSCFTVPSQFADFAKKVLKDNGDCPVSVRYGKPSEGNCVAQFQAENWVYTIRPLDGEFIDVDKLMANNSSGIQNDFIVNAKALCDIASEYEKNCGRNRRVTGAKAGGMHWILSEDSVLYTAVIAKDYHSVDSIGCRAGAGGYQHDAHIYVDFEFVKRVAALFGRHDVRIEFGNERGLLRFSDADDAENGYLGYIMPLRPNAETYAYALSMIDALRTCA